MLRETVDAEGAVGRRPWDTLTDGDVLRCAAVIDDRTAEDIASGGGLLSTLDIAGILGWGRG